MSHLKNLTKSQLISRLIYADAMILHMSRAYEGRPGEFNKGMATAYKNAHTFISKEPDAAIAYEVERIHEDETQNKKTP